MANENNDAEEKNKLAEDLELMRMAMLKILLKETHADNNIKLKQEIREINDQHIEETSMLLSKNCEVYARMPKEQEVLHYQMSRLKIK